MNITRKRCMKQSDKFSGQAYYDNEVCVLNIAGLLLKRESPSNISTDNSRT